MSLSITSLKEFSSALEKIGKEHVSIHDTATACAITNGTYARWLNRFFTSVLRLGQAENQAVYGKLIELIRSTPALGEKYAQQAGDFLKQERLSGGSPLSGLKAAKMINHILTAHERDMYVRAKIIEKNKECLDLCVQKIQRKFGPESASYAWFLAKQRMSKEEYVPLWVLHAYVAQQLAKAEPMATKRAREMVDALVLDLPEDRAAEVMRSKILSLRTVHSWVDNRDGVSTWIEAMALAEMERRLEHPWEKFTNPKFLAENESIVQRMGARYGGAAIPYARKFLAMSSTTEEMLEIEMRHMEWRLRIDAAALVTRELSNASGQDPIKKLQDFRKAVATDYSTNPHVADSWMRDILLTETENKIQTLTRSGTIATSVSVSMPVPTPTPTPAPVPGMSVSAAIASA